MLHSIASYEYLSDLGDNLPSSVSAIAPHVQIHWISSTAKGTISPLTAEAGMRVTNHYSDVEVAPGKLEIVLVPGAQYVSSGAKIFLEISSPFPETYPTLYPNRRMLTPKREARTKNTNRKSWLGWHSRPPRRASTS